jgi:hypothetical protein
MDKVGLTIMDSVLFITINITCLILLSELYSADASLYLWILGVGVYIMALKFCSALLYDIKKRYA